MGEGPDEHLETTLNIGNISVYLETSVDENKNNYNACDNRNVSHFTSNISDKLNISLNSLSSSEWEGKGKICPTIRSHESG